MAVAETATAVTTAAVVTVMVLAVATATAAATVMTAAVAAVAAVAAGVKRQPSTQLGTGMTKAGDGHEHNSRRQRTTRVQGG